MTLVGSKKVLVVEDDQDSRDLFVEVLMNDFHVHAAGDGREGLDAAAREPFDAIVLDLMMPVMSGVAFARELKARGSTVPLVVVSAMPDVAIFAERMGAHGYCRKPCPPPVLRALVHVAVSSRP